MVTETKQAKPVTRTETSPRSGKAVLVKQHYKERKLGYPILENISVQVF